MAGVAVVLKLVEPSNILRLALFIPETDFRPIYDQIRSLLPIPLSVSVKYGCYFDCSLHYIATHSFFVLAVMGQLYDGPGVLAVLVTGLEM